MVGTSGNARRSDARKANLRSGKTQAGQSTPGQRTLKRVPRSGNLAGLDAAAMEYAHLLVNPTTGPLVSGPFGDDNGGIITRFENDFVASGGSTDFNAYAAWVPGDNDVFLSAGAIASDTSNFTPVSVLNGPGIGFLTAQSSQYRCIAASMQIFYPGSELSRSGLVAIGQVPRAVAANGPTTTAALRVALQNVVRMPSGMVEVKWRPNDYDVLWTETGVADPSAAKHTALTFCAAGIPANTGVRIRLVGVYQWLPKAGEGIVTPLLSGNSTRNSYADIVRAADATGNWMFSTTSTPVRLQGSRSGI